MSAFKPYQKQRSEAFRAPELSTTDWTYLSKNQNMQAQNSSNACQIFDKTWKKYLNSNPISNLIWSGTVFII
jgi:hypothetical protein